jgi:hypothetical protein
LGSGEEQSICSPGRRTHRFHPIFWLKYHEVVGIAAVDDRKRIDLGEWSLNHRSSRLEKKHEFTKSCIPSHYKIHGTAKLANLGQLSASKKSAPESGVVGCKN